MGSYRLDSRAAVRGTVGWMAVMVVFAAVITPFIAMAEGWIVWWGSPLLNEGSEALLTLAPALVAALLIAGPLMAPSRVHSIARLAVIVPAVHVGLMIALYAIWQSAEIPLIRDDLIQTLAALDVPSLIGDGSILGVGAIGAALLLAAALATNRASRRRLVPRWLRPAVTFAVTYLLSLGFWLPLAAVIWATRVDDGGNHMFLIATVGTPAVLATMVASSADRRPHWWSRNAGAIAAILVLALGLALGLRFNSSPVAQALFINLIPVLLIAAMIALSSVVALALCQWRELRFHRFDGRRPTPWVQRGVVESTAPRGTPVGVVRFLGWLGGFRTELSPLSIRTETGHTVRVPPGSQLSCAPGPESVGSPAGETVVALRVGDPVAAAGYEGAMVDGPFRGSDAPVPSDRGVLVFGPHDPPLRQSLVLLLWRPCALYLLAAMAAIIPALLGYDGL